MIAKSADRKTRPVLPEPCAPGDMLKAPFVGNASIDDNLKECVQVGLWAVLGEAEDLLGVDVAKGVVTLSGAIGGETQRAKALAAAHAVKGVRKVIDKMEAGAPVTGTSAPEAASRPLVFVTRYCGESDASSAAAIRDAVAVLDGFLAEAGAAPAGELFVLYRNHLPGAITLEIGFPVAAGIAAKVRGEIQAGTTPTGPMASTLPAPGFGPVLAAGAELRGQGGAYCFQRFTAAQFRPWREHPSTPLMAPLGKAARS